MTAWFHTNTMSLSGAKAKHWSLPSLSTGQISTILQDYINQSSYFHEMKLRLLPLSQLELFLDSNEIIFRYNSKTNIFSVIQADYLLQNDYKGTPVYLFLAQLSDGDTQVCRTFFPKSGRDYAEGQLRYTLLKKEKRHLLTGFLSSIISFCALSPCLFLSQI